MGSALAEHCFDTCSGLLRQSLKLKPLSTVSIALYLTFI
jgi:hypothetical protein